MASRHRKKPQRKRQRRQAGSGGGRATPNVRPAALVGGLAGPAGTRLRLARPGESAEVAGFMDMAGVFLERPLVSAIDDGRIGRALLAGLRDGSRPLLAQLAAMGMSRSATDELAPLAAVLVAVRGDDVVGALMAYPPFGVIAQGAAAGIPLPQVLALGVVVVRFKGMGVNVADRGSGIGAALMRTGMGLYRQLGYKLLYGQIRSRDGLDRYYPRFGFEVLDADEPLPLAPLLDLPWTVYPEPGEQFIVSWA